MTKKEELKKYIGKKFGNLKVISVKTGLYGAGAKHYTTRLYCECSCGEYDFFTKASLDGGRKSCGCKRGPNGSTWKGLCPTGWVSHQKARAKQQKHEFLVTREDLISQYTNQNGICYLSGREIAFADLEPITKKTAAGKKIVTYVGSSASLDRYDSDEGYTRENIKFTHQTFNILKMDKTIDELFDECLEVVKHLNRTNPKRFKVTLNHNN